MERREIIVVVEGSWNRVFMESVTISLGGATILSSKEDFETQNLLLRVAHPRLPLVAPGDELHRYSLNVVRKYISLLDDGKCAKIDRAPKRHPYPCLWCERPYGHDGACVYDESTLTHETCVSNTGLYGEHCRRDPRCKLPAGHQSTCDYVQKPFHYTRAHLDPGERNDDARGLARAFNAALRSVTFGEGGEAHCDFDGNGMPIHVQMHEDWLTRWFEDAMRAPLQTAGVGLAKLSDETQKVDLIEMSVKNFNSVIFREMDEREVWRSVVKSNPELSNQAPSAKPPVHKVITGAPRK